MAELPEALTTPPPEVPHVLVSFPFEHVLLITLNRPAQLNAVLSYQHAALEALYDWASLLRGGRPQGVERPALGKLIAIFSCFSTFHPDLLDLLLLLLLLLIITTTQSAIARCHDNQVVDGRRLWWAR
ncbi:hypothetical protein VTK73DRAFT_4272 [Phialemonium thermophilum]|uniref:Uncharacterized protein n=1 Tax=Phialemonium thermophilum TaxID=223376 RepID=A0ABR3VA05_9PEZI